LHRPSPGGSVDLPSTFGLPRLRSAAPLVREHTRAQFPGVAWSLPELQGADIRSLPADRTGDGSDLGGIVPVLRGTLLLGIAVTDAREYIIPDEFSLGGLVLGLALSFAPGRPTPLWSVVGAALAFALMYGVAVVGEWAFKKPALGGGDIKMLAMIGAFLGPLHAVLTIFVGSVVGAVIFGPIALKTGRLVPFGVFLAVGSAVVFLWGDALVGWYVTHILGL